MGRYSYSLGKKCKHCGKPLGDTSTTGCCRQCRMTIEQRGPGNHMFGRKFTEEERRRIGEKTHEMWLDDDYRRKVIEGATGLKRTEEFKKGQSVRTMASYAKFPELRKVRGRIFSECWKNGKNHFHATAAKKSKGELEILNRLNKLGKYNVSTDEIRLVSGRYVAPDMVVDGKIVIEYYGDFYHAYEGMYADDFYNAKRCMTAKQIRERDEKRIGEIKESGYDVIIIWEHDYKDNPDVTFGKLIKDIEQLKECA